MSRQQREKKKCEHGEWLDWLADNCPEITTRTAQNYMRLYNRIKSLPNTKIISYLTPAQAFRELGIIKDPTSPVSSVTEPPSLPEGREIAQLETQDNENDEYHKEVPIVDVWAEYARLRDEEGWTQKEIGINKPENGKPVDRTQVSRRQKFHDELPKESLFLI